MSRPREGRWIARPLKRRLRFFDVAWIWSAAIYGVGFLDHLFHWFSTGFGQILAVGWLSLVLLSVTFLPLREAWMRRRKRRDQAFSDAPSAFREWAVEIEVEVGGKSIGTDRGVVWFERGLLGFTGERTSFLLAYDDFIWPGKSAISWIDVPFLPLKLRTEPPKASVAVRPLWGQGRRYRRKLRGFLRQREGSDVERQWPPLKHYAKQEAEASLAPPPTPPHRPTVA